MGDFKELPFPDDSFYLVVFDPPHLEKVGKSSWLAKKYGQLLPTWESDISAGIDECMRVLKPNGTLIFKWSNVEKPVGKVLAKTKHKPLFGHPTGKHGKTIWVTFMKTEPQE
jgi:ubiquinone/menaquinone biosynthesis C-methylase UbiE